MSSFLEQHLMTRPPAVPYDGLNFRRLAPDIRRLAEVAWDVVRGDDPPFPKCVRRWQETLVERAETVVRTGAEASDYTGEREAFEREFARVWNGG